MSPKAFAKLRRVFESTKFFLKKFSEDDRRASARGAFLWGDPRKASAKVGVFFRTSQMFREENSNFNANLTFDALSRLRGGGLGTERMGILGILGVMGKMGKGMGKLKLAHRTTLMVFFERLAI